jgi:hypothetical protein
MSMEMFRRNTTYRNWTHAVANEIFLRKSKGPSTLLVLVWLAMLASNVDGMTSHETSNTRRTSHWFVTLRLLSVHQRGSRQAARVMWTKTSRTGVGIASCYVSERKCHPLCNGNSCSKCAVRLCYFRSHQIY